MRIVAWLVISSSMLPFSLGKPFIPRDAWGPNLLRVVEGLSPITDATCDGVRFPLDADKPPVIPPGAPAIDLTGYRLVNQWHGAFIYVKRSGVNAEIVGLIHDPRGRWDVRRGSCTLRPGRDGLRTASWTFLKATDRWVTVRVFDSGLGCKDLGMSDVVSFAETSIDTGSVRLIIWSRQTPRNHCFDMFSEHPEIFHLELPEPLRGRPLIDAGAALG